MAGCHTQARSPVAQWQAVVQAAIGQIAAFGGERAQVELVTNSQWVEQAQVAADAVFASGLEPVVIHLHTAGQQGLIGKQQFKIGCAGFFSWLQSGAGLNARKIVEQQEGALDLQGMQCLVARCAVTSDGLDLVRRKAQSALRFDIDLGYAPSST